jgi:hypothetical protein
LNQPTYPLFFQLQVHPLIQLPFQRFSLHLNRLRYQH